MAMSPLKQQKYAELRTLIIDTFFKYNQRMGKKLFDHLTNKGVSVSLSFIKSVLKAHGFVSRTIKTYNKKKTHKSCDNNLNRQFEVSEEHP